MLLYPSASANAALKNVVYFSYTALRADTFTNVKKD